MNWHIYNFGSWTYNSGASVVGNCCGVGPIEPTTQAKILPTQLRGNWGRFEIVLVNRAGGSSPNGLTIRLYARNVTQNGTEFLLINTTQPCPSCEVEAPNNNWAWLNFNDLTPVSRLDELRLNLYRQNVCAGYRAVSHFMIAGWDTDEGQRISAATEIEGGVLPAAPTNLQISE